MRKSLRIIVLSVPIVRNGSLHDGAPTSQLSYVANAFRRNGHEVIEHDGYYWGRLLVTPAPALAAAVFVYFGRTEILDRDSLEVLLRQIEVLRNKFLEDSSCIYAFGPLSAAVIMVVRKKSGVVLLDAKERSAADLGLQLPTVESLPVERRRATLPQKATGFATIRASAGCSKHCSFCAYNQDYGEWRPRPMAEVIEDVDLRHANEGVTRIAFSDANFAPSKTKWRSRLAEFASALEHRKLTGHVRFSVNITHDCLDREIIGLMRACGIDRCLIGVEALTPSTCINIYRKAPVPEDFASLVEQANKVGIVPVLSLILFHPWLSLNDLCEEVRRLDNFGRHHFVHFMGNSFVRLVPGTALHERAVLEGLYLEQGIQPFQFKDRTVHEVFLDLRRKYVRHLHREVKTETRVKWKIAEWHYLKRLLPEIHH